MEKNEVMSVGLCGRSGSGKGTVCALFAACGIPSVDTDAVYHALTAPAPVPSPCVEELTERFGPSILAPDNSLDRAALPALVFGEENAENLRDLNAIAHRHILGETRRILSEYAEKGCGIVLIDAPVLFESGFDRFCSAVVCVTAPEDGLVGRIVKRDRISEEDARRRLAAQIPAEELEARSDFVIVNDGGLEELAVQVRETAEGLVRLREELMERRPRE